MLKEGFLNPPASARPGVYWYFMDGNLSREGITRDLESMKAAGIGHALFLEVNIGIPRGSVEFFSEPWLDLFRHAVRESERLGIRLSLGMGPGWSGSGGPWIQAEQSMQQLVSSALDVKGGTNQRIVLPVPPPKAPPLGGAGLKLSPDLKKRWEDYYADVCVLAFPTPARGDSLESLDRKALYIRYGHTAWPEKSMPWYPAAADYPGADPLSCVSSGSIRDLSMHLRSDGTLDYSFPPGNWTVVRFGKRNNGAVTRPAPHPGLGFESSVFDPKAIEFQYNTYIGRLISLVGKPDKNKPGGWKSVHIDSWEIGTQNWSDEFRREFIRARGYDCLPFLPVFSGYIVDSREVSERFLWDVRLTASELVAGSYSRKVKELCSRDGFQFSLEPYAGNPSADLDYGEAADVPMGEFWSKGIGYNSAYSCTEAASLAHVHGRKVAAAEAFTAQAGKDGWIQYPGSMKDQSDWAFAAGINHFVFHTFVHQPFDGNLKPGMTMGPFGVHWDGRQTWWPMADGYHRYVSRCQYVLQQGRTVADILYLTPEGAPLVFHPPSSALAGEAALPDRRGYNFDGCSPKALMKYASVRDHRIVFPSGAAYRLLVLPAVQTMSPGLLAGLESLLRAGAYLVGTPPEKAPGLENYPQCDRQIRKKAAELWGGLEAPALVAERRVGRGAVYWGGSLTDHTLPELYPDYEATSALIRKLGLPEDFDCGSNLRYTHRTSGDWDLYFVSNKTDKKVSAECSFRSVQGSPELWNPVTGETRMLPEYSMAAERTVIPMKFEPFQSFLVVFSKGRLRKVPAGRNFSEEWTEQILDKPWSVSFDPEWGGPPLVHWDRLEDWTARPEDGIRYYSGIATYRTAFQLPESVVPDGKSEWFLDLGEVNQLARVRLNGLDMGALWTVPFRVRITDALRTGKNLLEIEVANLWANRLIGDEQKPDDGIVKGQWPDWLRNGTPRSSGRFTFTTFRYYSRDSGLRKSGLIGPVKILIPRNTGE